MNTAYGAWCTIDARMHTMYKRWRVTRVGSAGGREGWGRQQTRVLSVSPASEGMVLIVSIVSDAALAPLGAGPMGHGRRRMRWNECRASGRHPHACTDDHMHLHVPFAYTCPRTGTGKLHWRARGGRWGSWEVPMRGRGQGGRRASARAQLSGDRAGKPVSEAADDASSLPQGLVGSLLPVPQAPCNPTRILNIPFRPGQVGVVQKATPRPLQSSAESTRVECGQIRVSEAIPGLATYRTHDMYHCTHQVSYG